MNTAANDAKTVTGLTESVPNGCYECGDREAPLYDSRTGATYCHECMYCLCGWELDGCPADTAIADGYVVESAS